MNILQIVQLLQLLESISTIQVTRWPKHINSTVTLLIPEEGLKTLWADDVEEITALMEKYKRL